MSAFRKPARRRRRANAVICGTSATSSSVAAELLLKEPRHIAAALVNDRRDDVRRMIAIDLDDELSEIGLEDVDAGAGERGVQLDLLADHRLRLHGGPGAVLLRDVGDDRDGVARRLGPVHVPAAGRGRRHRIARGSSRGARSCARESRARDRGRDRRVRAARYRRRGSPRAAWWRASSRRASPGPSARDRHACRRSPARCHSPPSLVGRTQCAPTSSFVLRPGRWSASSSARCFTCTALPFRAARRRCAAGS